MSRCDQSQRPNSPTGSCKEKELVERDGRLGFIRLTGSFKVMTNFVPKCVGYVQKSISDSKAQGFLIQIKQSETNNANDELLQNDEEQQREETFYLTWKHMSSQQDILNRLRMPSLWTAPSRDQFLPEYFKKICDEYHLLPDACRCFPVECHGLQESSHPPTWIFLTVVRGSPRTVIVQLDMLNNTVQVIDERQAAYRILDGRLPIMRISDKLDEPNMALKRVINFASEAFSENFGGFLLGLGGLAMAFHYETLSKANVSVPAVMVVGSPVSSKSKAVELILSMIGVTEDSSVGSNES